jgi:hypothetical protein
MFQDALGSAQTSIGAFLSDQLARFGDDPVAQGMRYASDGGKRLRGFLVLETAGLFGVPAQQALYAAAAVECVHAYSLVHDDLPCMDDDDLRRGRPTVHKTWDEATAVLVGDALQTFAFELLADPAAGRCRSTPCTDRGSRQGQRRRGHGSGPGAGHRGGDSRTPTDPRRDHRAPAQQDRPPDRMAGGGGRDPWPCRARAACGPMRAPSGWPSRSPTTFST